MTNKRDHLATFRINKEVWDRFQSWCSEQDLSASMAMCKLIDNCLDGSIPSLLPSNNNDLVINNEVLVSLQEKVTSLDTEVNKRLDELEKKLGLTQKTA